MYKLLPEKRLNDIEREYKFRRSILMIISLCVVFAIGIAILVPLYIFSMTKERSAVNRLEVTKKLPLLENGQNIDEWLKSTKEKQRILAPALKKDEPYEYFNRIISLKPEGISLKNLSWKRDPKGTVISVNGIASTRNTLLMFEQALNNSGQFSKAALPVSNLARDKNIDFSLTISPL